MKFRNKIILQKKLWEGRGSVKKLYSQNCPEEEKANITMKPKTCRSIKMWTYALLLECSHDYFIRGCSQCENESKNLETKETKKREKHTSHLWIVIKREIMIYGLVPRVGEYLILYKLPLSPENSCNKK